MICGDRQRGRGSEREDRCVRHTGASEPPGPALHADGVAAAEVEAELGAVAAALVVAALEVPVLVEDDVKAIIHRKTLLYGNWKPLYIYSYIN